MNQEPTDKSEQVWKLLDNASSVKPSAQFSRNVVREIRLNETSQSESLWKKCFKPTYALVALAVVCAIVALPILLQNETDTSGVAETDSDNTEHATTASGVESSTVISDFSSVIDDDEMVSEFLVTLSENPDILTEDDFDAFFLF